MTKEHVVRVKTKNTLHVFGFGGFGGFDGF